MTERIAGLLAVEVGGAGLVGIEAPSYRGFRYPAEIISHCVWLSYRFPLSLREVQEMMLQRGIIVSHETIRQWCAKFGQTYAHGLRRRHLRPGDKWHLDEVFITINGKCHYAGPGTSPGTGVEGLDGPAVNLESSVGFRVVLDGVPWTVLAPQRK